MKKLFYLATVVAMLASSCSNKNELVGKLSNSDCDGKTVYLLAMKDYDSRVDPIDSAVITGGQFRFDLKDNVPGLPLAYLVIKDAPRNIANGITFAYEKGSVKVDIDSTARVSGTPLNDKVQSLSDKLAPFASKMKELGKKMDAATDEAEQQQYYGEIKKLDEEEGTILFGFVKENIKNKLGEYYFLGYSDMFTEEQSAELLAEASPEIQAKVNEKKNAVKPNSFVGKSYIDVTGPAPDGKNISLSSYVGKNNAVLVDFWASWCGPCRREMPNVVDAYNKFHDKGFEIVGISLDDEKDKWVEAIGKLNIKWPQMSDLKGWESTLSKPYNVRSIPFTILIDKNGTIVAENLRGESLHKKLAELLK
jgi:peroxiredoxin